MSAPPYQKFFWGSYHKHTAHLGHAREHGAYLLLIGALWNNQGRLPADDATLAGYAKLTIKEWEAVRPKLINGTLLKIVRGKLTQPRVTEDLEKYRDTSGKRKEAGKTGGNASARNRKGNGAAIATDLPTKPEPEPEPVEDITPKPPEGAFAVETFDLAWDAYPESGKATTSRSASRASWARACAKIDPQRLLSAVRRFAASETVTGAGAKKPPKMTVWLDNERFDAFLPAVNAPAAARAWTGPPALWADVAARLGEAWAKVNLGDCEFHDGELTTSSPTTEANIRRGCSDALARHDVRLTFTARPNAQAA